MQANVKKCERLPEQLFNIVQVIDANDEGRDVNESKQSTGNHNPLRHNYRRVQYVFLGEEDVEEGDKVDHLSSTEVHDVRDGNLRLGIVKLVPHLLIGILEVQVEEYAQLCKHYVEPRNVLANVVKIVLLVLQIKTVTLPFTQCFKCQDTRQHQEENHRKDDEVEIEHLEEKNDASSMILGEKIFLV